MKYWQMMLVARKRVFSPKSNLARSLSHGFCLNLPQRAALDNGTDIPMSVRHRKDQQLAKTTTSK